MFLHAFLAIFRGMLTSIPGSSVTTRLMPGRNRSWTVSLCDRRGEGWCGPTAGLVVAREVVEQDLSS